MTLKLLVKFCPLCQWGVTRQEDPVEGDSYTCSNCGFDFILVVLALPEKTVVPHGSVLFESLG